MEVFHIDNHNNFTIRDSVPKEFFQQSVFDLLKNIIKLGYMLEKSAKAYFGNDDKLLGQEKANLINEMKGIIRNSVALIVKLESEPDMEPENPPLMIEITKDEYSIMGKITRHSGTERFSYLHWLQNIFVPYHLKLGEFIIESLKDRSLSREEMVSVAQKVRGFVEICVYPYHLLLTQTVHG